MIDLLSLRKLLLLNFVILLRLCSAWGNANSHHWGAQLKAISSGLIKASHTVVGGLVVASCLLASGGAAFGDDVTDPGVVVTEPGPQEPQPEPLPMDPAPADPAPVEPIPLPVEPAPVPVEQPPAPVYPAPVPVQPAPVYPGPVPVQPAPVPAVPAPVVPAPVVPAPIPVPAPGQTVPRAVITVPLLPAVPGSVAVPVPVEEPTPLSQALESVEAFGAQASAVENPQGETGAAQTPVRPSSRSTASSAPTAKSPLSPQALPAIAETQLRAAVAVATGSPFIVQLMTVLALVGVGVLYFRFMGAKGLRTPSRSRK
ncbi:MAG: hypothetical protein JWQ56_2084 [Pseudarthrobacter sp.]|nr:hypothetical protein [Pseudarthrobacter sp.]